MRRYQFTSESVTEGHPDKVCDQISDAILDGILAKDPRARVACETMVKTGMAVVAGEITTSAWVDMPVVVRQTIKEIGYTDSSMGFDWETCAVLTAIEKQSPDISQGVTEGEGLHKEQGAGDQGLMFGYATDETVELMPAPISYAHKLAKKLAEVRKAKKVSFLRPDGKTQVTMEYEGDVPVRAAAIVVSTQHSPEAKQKHITEAVRSLVIEKVFPAKLIDKNTRIYVNPTGRFVIGGPYGDAGLTGRKIIVDTYGGMGRHGGGAFSGKDPSKVDRSACYYARFVAKNVVASGLARRCEVQIAYAIGVAQPVGVNVNTFGTGKVDEQILEKYIQSHFDMRPKAIIEQLDLLKPIYKKTAAYGHFGRDEFTWEQTTRAAKMADDLSRPSAIAVANGAAKRGAARHEAAAKNGPAKHEAAAKNGAAKNGPAKHEAAAKNGAAKNGPAKQEAAAKTGSAAKNGASKHEAAAKNGAAKNGPAKQEAAAKTGSAAKNGASKHEAAAKHEASSKKRGGKKDERIRA